jgi:hypothetical protein
VECYLPGLGISVPEIGGAGVYINAPITGSSANVKLTVGVNVCFRAYVYPIVDVDECVPADPGLKLMNGKCCRDAATLFTSDANFCLCVPCSSL